jgi:hypothetical protein
MELEPLEAMTVVTAASSERTQSASNESKDSKDPSSTATDEDLTTKDEIKELLLCLRPIRDGEEIFDESLRFVPKIIHEVSDLGTIDDCSPCTSTTSTDGASRDPGSDRKGKLRPPKKRPVDSDPIRTFITRPFITRLSSSGSGHDSDPMAVKKCCAQEDATEKSAVESLLLMGNNNAG